MRKKTWGERLPRLTRDGALFLTGLGGVIHETVVVQEIERPTLLLIFCAMLGLPLFIRADERKRDG